MTATQRWILISNCQTYGLAHSLQMLAEGVSVEPVDVAEYGRQIDRYNAGFGEYERVLVGRSAMDLAGADFSRGRRVDELPELAFSAFHPDMTYVTDGASLIGGPLEVYHSTIAFLSHRRGLTVDETLPLFNARIYAACGYLDRWTAARDDLIGHFKAVGLDVGHSVRRWGRNGAFMYSTNHPRIHVLYDIARIYLEREGFTARVSDVLPLDNLAHSSVFPVYPEVGDVLGVPGAYLFKRAHQYTQIGLRQYVEECFATYDAHPAGGLATHEVFRASSERVSAVLDEEFGAR